MQHHKFSLSWEFLLGKTKPQLYVSSPRAKTVKLRACFQPHPIRAAFSVFRGSDILESISSFRSTLFFTLWAAYSSRRHATPYLIEEGSHPGNCPTWPSIFWCSGLSCMCHHASQGVYNHTTARRHAIPRHTGKGSNIVTLLTLPSHGSVPLHFSTHTAEQAPTPPQLTTGSIGPCFNTNCVVTFPRKTWMNVCSRWGSSNKAKECFRPLLD